MKLEQRLNTLENYYEDLKKSHNDLLDQFHGFLLILRSLSGIPSQVAALEDQAHKHSGDLDILFDGYVMTSYCMTIC